MALGTDLSVIQHQQSVSQPFSLRNKRPSAIDTGHANGRGVQTGSFGQPWAGTDNGIPSVEQRAGTGADSPIVTCYGGVAESGGSHRTRWSTNQPTHTCIYLMQLSGVKSDSHIGQFIFIYYKYFHFIEVTFKVSW